MRVCFSRPTELLERLVSAASHPYFLSAFGRAVRTIWALRQAVVLCQPSRLAASVMLMNMTHRVTGGLVITTPAGPAPFEGKSWGTPWGGFGENPMNPRLSARRYLAFRSGYAGSIPVTRSITVTSCHR
jgi:hypothetical protein